MFNDVNDRSAQISVKSTRRIPTQRSASRRFVRSILILAFSSVVLLQSVGCVTGPGAALFDEPLGGYRNHVWANRAYNLRYRDCDRQFESHFKQGFCDGYTDVSNGGDGYVPAVPPEEYWSYQYQSSEGAKCVNTWFKAYPLGVKAAREDGAGNFQKVYISKMIQSAITQEKADHVLPDDVPVVTPEKDIEQPPVTTGNDPNFNAANLYNRSATARNLGPNYRY